MTKDNETLVVETSITEGKRKKEKGFTVVDPILELNLGEHAYKVVKGDMADTAKSLRNLGLNYYSIRGGEIQSKSFNKDRTGVVFNKDLPDQFEIPLEEGPEIFPGNVTDQWSSSWYSERAQAIAVCKALSEAEIGKTSKVMEDWQKAQAFYKDQIEEEKF